MTITKRAAVSGRRVPVAIRRRDLKPGDVILDGIGNPYFRVVSIRPAAKLHYFVLVGDQLRPGPQTGGHGDTLVPVLRLEFESRNQK